MIQEDYSLESLLTDSLVQQLLISDYGFSKKFGWLDDRFGVSWQLNLPL
ncbi:hypothetical protein E2K98_28910 [Bacillus salipaludis]|uniref:PhnB-like domain-containing protein n=1 Tax=Bacillus salipaludis TaxID=2547811 RepID=A0A4R5VJR7_9BACI|nr:hypothetical protein E2K98_28910 [Bacillus salipaludis]